MSILDKAKETVDSDRQSQYGDPVRNAVRQAIVASAMEGRPFSPVECNSINFAQKVVRMGIHSKEDTMVDVAGYTEIRARLIKAQLEGEVQEIVEDLLYGWVDFGVLPHKPLPEGTRLQGGRL